MLSNEQIQKSWWNYLKKMFPPLPGERLPYLFSDPHCGTCAHWFLIDYDGLHHLAITSSPSEYDNIVDDLKGNHIFDYRVNGEVEDVYTDYCFYGWCKRSPPVQRSGYSVVGFRSVFSFLSRNIPQKIAKYGFPLMPHDCSCGEWKENHWVADFVNKHMPASKK